MRTRLTDSRPATARAGFSFVEVLATLALGAIIMMLAAPRVTLFRDRSAVRAARDELLATAEAARGAALQRGRTSRLIVSGDSIRAEVDTGPPGLAPSGTQVVLRSSKLQRDYKVSLVLAYPSDSLVSYDGRGFANPRIGHVARFTIVGTTTRDSMCIASFGTVLPRGCAP